MLVLTRKKNETIRIGGNVVVKVIATGRGKVKIGIEAPATVRVRRGELAPEVEPVTESDEDEPLTARVYQIALA